jgi:hypothetical protein
VPVLTDLDRYDARLSIDMSVLTDLLYCKAKVSTNVTVPDPTDSTAPTAPSYQSRLSGAAQGCFPDLSFRVVYKVQGMALHSTGSLRSVDHVPDSEIRAYVNANGHPARAGGA